MTAEDKRFFAHGGVDWLALGGAARARLTGHHARGASTISMQLAAFLSPQIGAPGARGWLDKLKQMRAAWAIERGWSKNEILEAYLNLAPMRGEAQGHRGRRAHLVRQAAGRARPARRRSPDRAPAGPCGSSGTHRDARLQGFEGPGLHRNSRDKHANAVSGTPFRARSGPRAPSRRHLLRIPGARVTSTLDLHVQNLATQSLRHQLQDLGPHPRPRRCRHRPRQRDRRRPRLCRRRRARLQLLPPSTARTPRARPDRL